MFYRIRESIGTIVQLKHFVAFSTIEEAIKTDVAHPNTFAIILEFEETPKENHAYKFSEHLRAEWDAKSGWVTPDNRQWDNVNI